MEDANSSRLTPIAVNASNLQEGYGSERSTKVIRDSLGFCGGGGAR